MEFIFALGDQIWSLISYLIPFIFVLSVIVFVHEMGHYAVARWCAIGVEAFSIGFGHEIYGWNDKNNTRWSIRWIPLGGYVKFYGDADPSSFAAAQDNETEQGDHPKPEDDKSKEPNTMRGKKFNTAPLWARACVVSAGPIANFLLTAVVLSATLFFVGQSLVSPIVDEVVEGSAAEKAGIMPKDRILDIDGNKINVFRDIPAIVSKRSGETLPFTILRNGNNIILNVTPELTEIDDGFGGKITVGRIGIIRQNLDQAPIETYGLFGALTEGTKQTLSMMKEVTLFAGRLLVGNESGDQLSGPVKIAQISGKVAENGWISIFNLIAVLSVSIGIINLFPIPILDGGHLLFYAFEAVRGKPLSQNIQNFSYQIGLVFIVGLMLYVTWNDITGLGWI